MVAAMSITIASVALLGPMSWDLNQRMSEAEISANSFRMAFILVLCSSAVVIGWFLFCGPKALGMGVSVFDRTRQRGAFSSSLRSVGDQRFLRMDFFPSRSYHSLFVLNNKPPSHGRVRDSEGKQ